MRKDNLDKTFDEKLSVRLSWYQKHFEVWYVALLIYI